MLRKQLHKSISADISEAKNAVLEILNFLKDENIPLTEEDFFDLKLVFSELIFNAVIHGNKENTEKKVDIKLDIHNNELYCEIKDEGNGFDYNALITTLSYDSSEALYSEHGRGIKLALSLVDKLNFNKIGNSIKIFKRLNANE